MSQKPREESAERERDQWFLVLLRHLLRLDLTLWRSLIILGREVSTKNWRKNTDKKEMQNGISEDWMGDDKGASVCIAKLGSDRQSREGLAETISVLNTQLAKLQNKIKQNKTCF